MPSNNPRGKPKEWSYSQVKAALKLCQGYKTKAARMLGMKSSSTISRYIEYWPSLQVVLDEAEEIKLDEVESLHMQAMKRGDTQALNFFLKTRGRERGYVEKNELDVHAHGNFEIVLPPALEK